MLSVVPDVVLDVVLVPLMLRVLNNFRFLCCTCCMLCWWCVVMHVVSIVLVYSMLYNMLSVVVLGVVLGVIEISCCVVCWLKSSIRDDSIIGND